MGAAVAIGVIAFLAVAAFSTSGQQRLGLLGLDPILLIGVLMLLFLGGLAIVRAGTPEDFEDQPLERSAEQAPAPGE